MYIILLGPPGAGKGTQATELSASARLAHIASGDLFRDVRESTGELGALVRSYYDRGELVPDEVTIQLILERLEKDDCRQGALLDGFPRTLKQAEALDAALQKRGARVDKVLSIEVTETELLRRLGGRWLCRTCGRPYHLVSAPPERAGVCDACHGVLYQRPDDTEETAKNRLAVYFNQTMPLTSYYRSQGKLVEVDGDQPVKAVTKDVLAALTLSSPILAATKEREEGQEVIRQ